MAGVRGRSGGARKGAGRKPMPKAKKCFSKEETKNERAAYAKAVADYLRAAKRRGEWRGEVPKDPLKAAVKFVVHLLIARAVAGSDVAAIHLAERISGKVKAEVGIEAGEGIQGIGFAFKYVDDPRVGGSSAHQAAPGTEETS